MANCCVLAACVPCGCASKLVKAAAEPLVHSLVHRMVLVTDLSTRQTLLQRLHKGVHKHENIYAVWVWSLEVNSRVVQSCI